MMRRWIILLRKALHRLSGNPAKCGCQLLQTIVFATSFYLHIAIEINVIICRSFRQGLQHGQYTRDVLVLANMFDRFYIYIYMCVCQYIVSK